MANGRLRHEWSRTASLMAMLFNINRDPRKTDPASPDDFNPYAIRKKPAMLPGGFAMLEAAFGPKH